MNSQVSQKRKVAAVLNYLAKNRLMTLGTSFKNKPWVATTFFAFDNKFNIIFYSRDDTKHSREIRKNANVSVVINHTWKQAGGGINGLQMTGRASKVSKKDYVHHCSLYKKRFSWADDFVSDHRLYIIKPKEIWLIDEKLFGHFHRVRVA